MKDLMLLFATKKGFALQSLAKNIFLPHSCISWADPTHFSPDTLCFQSGGICMQLAQRSGSLQDKRCFLAGKY